MSERSRGPGRPPSDRGGDVSERLLEEASRLFSRRGFAGTSLRDLAEAAGVTTAMVSYYFGSKEGLYRALLEQALGQLLAGLEGAAGAPATGAPAEGDLGRLVETMLAVTTETMAARPWIPSLLVREVLTEGGSFREEFIERFASRVAGRVIGELETAAAAGALRPGVDPRLAYVSLIGLVMFPLLGRPVLERILGLSFDDPGFLDTLRGHGHQLFFHGVAAPEAS